MAKKKENGPLGHIKRLIDEASGPDFMTKEQAVEFLEDLQADIEGRLDCLREELQNDD